jgi:hypothetical protein
MPKNGIAGPRAADSGRSCEGDSSSQVTIARPSRGRRHSGRFTTDRRGALTCRYCSHESAQVRSNRPGGPKVVGSNPASPTQECQVRGGAGAPPPPMAGAAGRELDSGTSIDRPGGLLAAVGQRQLPTGGRPSSSGPFESWPRCRQTTWSCFQVAVVPATVQSQRRAVLSRYRSPTWPEVGWVDPLPGVSLT